MCNKDYGVKKVAHFFRAFPPKRVLGNDIIHVVAWIQQRLYTPCRYSGIEGGLPPRSQNQIFVVEYVSVSHTLALMAGKVSKN